MSSSIQYKESCWRDFVRLVRSHAKRKLVLFHLVRGIKQAGIRYKVARKEGMSSSGWYVETSRWDYVRPIRSHARGASPRPSVMRNQACRTLSIRYEVARNESLSSFVPYQESRGRVFVHLVRSHAKQGLVQVLPYEESSKRDFLRLVRSRAKGEHVLVWLVCGINQA